MLGFGVFLAFLVTLFLELLFFGLYAEKSVCVFWRAVAVAYFAAAYVLSAVAAAYFMAAYVLRGVI